MSIPSDPHNPYASPFGARAAPPGRRSTTAFPIFAKTMFIIDLVLCSLRVPLVLLGFVGYAALQRENNPMLATVATEILTGFGIVVFGIPANICALFRKPWAAWLGWLNVAATLGSVGIGAWQATFKMAEFAPGSPEKIGGYIGLAFVLLFRLGLLGMYGGALVQFSGWVKRLPPTAASSF